MKKTTLILTILALLASCSYACANPTADSVGITSAEGDHDEVVQVMVNITNVMNGPIQSIKFDVDYDVNVIELVATSPGDVLPIDPYTGTPLWSVTLGTNKKSITLGTTLSENALANGTTGNITVLYFKATGDPGDTTPLELSGIELSDPSGFKLGTAPAINGTFTIPGGVSPPPQEPFLIYGHVWYENDTPCNDPSVEITNLNTGGEWAAGVSGNYYQIALASGVDLNATEVLRFNATDGTTTNVTDHTITADDVDTGGLFGFNLTLESIDLAPYLATYTISNITISPDSDGIMDDTEIDVEFSETVAAAIKIENASGVIKTLYTSSSVKNPDTKTWDGTDAGGNIVADGTYHVNVTMDDGVNPLVYDNTRSITVTCVGSTPTADSVGIMSAEGDYGDIAQVMVNITNVMNGPIQSIKFDVDYDVNVIELVATSPGDVLPIDPYTGTPLWSVTLGTNKKSITLGTTLSENALANGTTGNITVLYFNVTGNPGDTTPLELSGIELSDPSGFKLGTAPAIDGIFTIPCKPYSIDGYVGYENGTSCNNPRVSITNLNTGKEWTAGTSGGSNYYQITLAAGTDLNATEVLRFNATDGTNINVTDHTVTADEVDGGGLVDFNLTLESTNFAPHLVTYTISNTTITPNGDGIEDDTEIDVEFSEPVDATILIENATGVVKSLYTSSSKVTDPTPKTWGGTDDGGNIVADGTYQVNITMDDGVNPMVYNNTRSIVVTTSVVDPSPSLVTYTISNTTISPNGDGIMDDTEIDVEFSEPVDATILIENATGVVRSLYISPDDVTDPDPQIWNGTDDGGNIMAYGTYRVNVTMDDGVNPIVYDNTRSIMVANMSVATISIGNGSGIVTIPIAIEDGVNVGACDIALTYNASVVNVTGVTGGDMDVTFANLEHVHEGFVRIGTFQTNNPGLNGNIVFANVMFEPIGATGDTCSLNLSVTTFKDETPEGNPMPYILRNGTYCTLLNGDVNGDGVVDIHDAMYLAKHVLDKSGFEVIIVEAADVSGDDMIDLFDASYLAKHVLEISGYEELR